MINLDNVECAFIVVDDVMNEGFPKNVAVIREALDELIQWRENVEYILDDIGPQYAVRVHEGGSPDEDLIMSLVVTIMKLRKAIPERSQFA